MSAHIGEAQISITLDTRAADAALLELSRAVATLVLLSRGRPRPLAIDGAGYRRRTRRRKS